jgi:tyrosyl-tRNA synthetase
MLLQAHDFLHLYDHYGCAIQAGGSDQWGNITAGIELIRKVRGGHVGTVHAGTGHAGTDQAGAGEAFGITFPLLETSSGEKFGKSAGNAVWLDPARTSPYQFYQYWIRTDDRDVEKLLKLFTFLEVEEIDAIVAAHVQAPEQRAAQKQLAEKITRLVHGDANLTQAMKSSEALFGGEISGLSDRDLADIFADVPSFTVEESDIQRGLRLPDLLVRAGAAKSKGEATRLIAGGGVYLNNRRLDGAESKLQRDQLASETMFVVRVGKKSYYLGRITR